jgi:hypothetical protein
MKMIWLAAAAAALTCASTAQAAPIILTGQFNGTDTFEAAPNGTKTVSGPSIRTYSFTGDSATGLFNFSGAILGVAPCTNCFQLGMSGDKIGLSFLGNNPPLPGFVLASVTWTFDQDLLGDVFNVFNANMVSGSVYALFSNRSGTNTLTGSAVSFSASSVGGAVPEPGTWAMMIVGMGIVGASLRRKTRIAFA